MICNTIGLTSDSFETLYVHGGAEVPEVYGSINYAQPIFYSLKALTGATSYSFMGYSEPLKSYEIDGNMVQSSTPTPTSPIYPQECGDIWNHWNRMLVRYHFGKVPDENSVSFYGNGAMFQIEAVPNVNYTLEQDSSPSTSMLRIYRSNSPLVESPSLSLRIRYDSMVEWDGAGTPKVTINSGSFKYIWIQFGSSWYNSYGESATISLVGDYAVPLTVNGTPQNLYLTEPLRKIGDYADSINSDGTVTRRIKKLVLTGEENWQKSSSTSAYYCSDAKFGATYLHRQILATVCTHYKSVINAANTSGLSDGEMCLFASTPDTSLGTQEVYVKDNNIVDAAAFKTFLATQYANGTPVTVWYVLATPTTEQVTTPTLTPATGNNTLAISTTLQPSSVSITGHIKPSS